jgi:hypothetical protein
MKQQFNLMLDSGAHHFLKSTSEKVRVFGIDIYGIGKLTNQMLFVIIPMTILNF